MSTLADPPVPTSRGSQSASGRKLSQVATESDPFLNRSDSRPRPLQVTWEMTQACSWKSTPPRVKTRSAYDRNQFSTAEAFHLVEEVAAMRVPLLALTGGDPLLRPDLFPVIEFASRLSVRTSLTMLPTPKLDATAIAELKASGLMRAGFWLHGSTAALDDAYWAVPGCHKRTLEVIGSCHEEQLPVQVNTIVGRRNLHDLDPMIELLTRLDICLLYTSPSPRD